MVLHRQKMVLTYLGWTIATPYISMQHKYQHHIRTPPFSICGEMGSRQNRETGHDRSNPLAQQ